MSCQEGGMMRNGMDPEQRNRIDRLAGEHRLAREEWETLIEGQDEELQEYAAARAREVAVRNFGHDVYTRGLIEFTNVCKNDCLYCGIRKSQRQAHRYRLTAEEILECCEQGYELGFRTFVLQGGEDPACTEQWIEELVRQIKGRFPDCAVTLSVGEHSRETYERWYQAGAERYLLRHETADAEHYAMLHPEEMSWAHRMQCLRDLKEIGYQTGCGFMVGSPGQTARHLAEDMVFLQEFRPHMIGIGPFIPAGGTPFAHKKAGTLKQTLYLLSLIRLMHPQVLLPATTALGTIHPQGRELGILAGANVVMPNLSPVAVRKKYALYDDKICTGEESAQCRHCLDLRLERIGYSLSVSRGDSPFAEGAASS